MGIEKLFEILIKGETIFAALNDGGMPNIPFPTLGGVIFWDNIRECCGWKLHKKSLGKWRSIRKDI